MEGFALRRNYLPLVHIKVQIKFAVSRSLLGGTCTAGGTRHPWGGPLAPLHVVLFLSRSLESSVDQEIPRILWNRRFISVSTTARQLTTSWARRSQSMSSHSLVTTCLFSAPHYLYDSSFSTTTHAIPFPPPTHTPPPPSAHMHNIWWAAQTTKLLITQFSPFPLIPSLSALFSNIHGLLSWRNIVVHWYNDTTIQGYNYTLIQW